MGDLVNFLNKIPNVAAFIKKLQEEGLSVKIVFDMMSSAGLAFFLMIAIAGGVFIASLMQSKNILTKVLGFASVAVAFFIGYMVINQQTPTEK